MRKYFILLCIILVFVVSKTYSQQVERDMVVLEISTGTWCYYCPGAAMGAEDLIENGKDVAVIEYHNGDDFANIYSNYRNNYYNVTGIPTAVFDGKLKYVGGSHSQSLYSIYLPKYNQRKAIPSSFTIDMNGTNSGLIDYDVDIDVNKVAAADTSNLVLHTVLTESNIDLSWQGQSEINFAERLMIPNQFGTPLNFSEVNTQQVNVYFSLEPSWVADNCELVVFIQNKNTKEIMQASKTSLSEFVSGNNYDAAIIKTSKIPLTDCDGKLSPGITIRNNGLENLTSLNINYVVNDENINNFAWTGNLAYLETTDIDLPEIEFTTQDINTFVAYISSPNGNEDQFHKNDTATTTFDIAPSITSTLYLLLKPDNNPEETTWEVRNSDNEILYSGGPYDNSSVKIDTFNFTSLDCYKFIIYDSNGNGINNGNGFGIYRLIDSNGHKIADGGNFYYQEETQFNSGNVGITAEKTYNTDFQIFPNPFNKSTNISFNLYRNESFCLNIYNILGKVIYSEHQGNLSAGKHLIKFNRNELKSGIYFVRLKVGNKIFTKKVSLIK